jgi:hypothetical protein
LLALGLVASAFGQSSESDPPPGPPPEFPTSAAIHVVGDHILLAGQIVVAVGLAVPSDGVSLWVGGVTAVYTIENLQNAKRKLEEYRKARKAWEDAVERWKGRNPGKEPPRYGLGMFDEGGFAYLVDFGFEYQILTNALPYYDSYP